VPVGTTSPQQVVTITNVGTAPVEMSGVGGAPGAPFSGTQICQGITLAPGASCQMFFRFSPTEPGPASANSVGSWNGIPFNISLTGAGIAPYELLGFFPPLDQMRSFTAGSGLPVRFAVHDSSGQPISDAEAEELAATCSAIVTFTGDPDATYCARYDGDAGQFVAVVHVPRNLAPGTYLLNAALQDQTLVTGSLTVEVTVRQPGRAP
jgi:hypothetical protein